MESIFARYPRLRNLLGKVPLDAVEADLKASVSEYEALKPRATTVIPTAHLADVLDERAEHGGIELNDFLGQWGNISVEELCKLCLAVRWLEPNAIFEIGTYNGLTTKQLALNAPRTTVYTLDIDPSSADASGLEIGEIDRHLANKTGDFSFDVGHKFRDTPLSKRIVQLWGDSRLFDYSPYQRKMNLVFIDAGHTYDFVRSDTQNALTLLDPEREGLIFWHDYDQVLHPGVTRFLVEFAESGRRVFHLRNTNLAVLRVSPAC